MTDSPTLSELDAEARRILTGVEEEGLPLRLAGGTAFMLRCPHAQRAPLARAHGDLDFVGLSSATKRIQDLFSRLGYAPNQRFNSLHSRERLLFSDDSRGRDVDVILDHFRMCHVIDLRDRLDADQNTLSLIDLLLCKMQVVQLNEKDVRDVQALLLDFPVGRDDDGKINLDRLSNLTSRDWGLYHTVQINLGRVRASAGGIGLGPGEEEQIGGQVETLLHAMEQTPKSPRWKARAQIGERLRWYDLPDEVEHR